MRPTLIFLKTPEDPSPNVQISSPSYHLRYQLQNKYKSEDVLKMTKSTERQKLKALFSDFHPILGEKQLYWIQQSEV